AAFFEVRRRLFVELAEAEGHVVPVRRIRGLVGAHAIQRIRTAFGVALHRAPMLRFLPRIERRQPCLDRFPTLTPHSSSPQLFSAARCSQQEAPTRLSTANAPKATKPP